MVAIERNAFLESELDEKEAMSFMVQRLKDEARDLKQELMIQQSSVHKEQSSFGPDSPLVQRRDSTGGTTPLIPARAHHSRILGMSDSNRLATEKAASNGTAQQLPLGMGSSGQTPLTPSARVSALNIVGDLLRKVGQSPSSGGLDLGSSSPRHKDRKPATDSSSPRACEQHSNSQGTYSSTSCIATSCPSYSLKTA
ncbi:hypothetical protein HPB52_009248 [Rhipicephalus sanguineus]|uniref:NUDE domain-containing protein n=1 Tax=Rhipicephalus sanguineus TaxID=34632 RepID=A0A9D4SS10_RHISA|nr:hypothetical protein HPB52_009248 [Rhipicephalus sanguineus]